MADTPFHSLPGTVIGIADHLGWPIELGDGVVVHFDGPNHRVEIRARAVDVEQFASVEPVIPPITRRMAKYLRKFPCPSCGREVTKWAHVEPCRELRRGN